MAKFSKTVVQEQLSEVNDLLCRRIPVAKIKSDLAPKWDTTRRYIGNLIRACNQEAEDSGKEGRSTRRAKSVARLARWQRKGLEGDSPDLRLALDLEKEVNKLQGNYEPDKSEVDIGEVTRAALLGQYVVEISDEELDAACDVSEQ